VDPSRAGSNIGPPHLPRLYVPPQTRRLTLDVAARVARIGRVEPHTWRASREASYRRFHRNRTSKLRNAVAIAEGGRGGEVRFLSEFAATEAAMRKLVAKLAAKYDKLTFCYEAGPTG